MMPPAAPSPDEEPEADPEELEGGLPDDVDLEAGDLDPEEGEQGAAAKAAPEPEEEPVEFAGHKVPPRAELRKALAWAFDGCEVPDAYLDSCAHHAELMLDENTRMNLTKIVDPKEVAAKHYLDSWRATQLLPLLGKRVLDIGTGAGFPGIPVALAESDAQVVVLDSTGKKAEFVQKAIEAMGLKNVTALAERGEEHLQRNRFDVVMMRAISSVRENVRLLRKVRHSLIDLVMLKGPSWSREVRAAEREAERLGFRLDTVWEHQLPGELGDRAVLVYRAPGGAGL